jgi:hypothetical protein
MGERDMTDTHDSADKRGGQRRREDRPSGRDDRPRGRPEGRRERPDSRERRPFRAGGPRRDHERRPGGAASPEDEKWAQVPEEEIRSQTRQLIQGSNLMETGFGARRFYFVARSGRMPFLDISDDMASRLANGMAAIVELPGEGGAEEYSVIPRGLALRLKVVDPQIVRFFNEDS